METHEFTIEGVERLQGVTDSWQVKLYNDNLDREFAMQAHTITMYVGEERARGFLQAMMAGIRVTITMPSRDVR